MKISTIVKGMALSAALIGSLTGWAGNIPQYSFKQDKAEFKFLEDATQLNVIYKTADEMMFPGDRQTLTAYTGQGFPIGFDFRYGGRVFNQFAINNNGYILLGYDKVEFRGYCNLFFNDATRYASNSFFMGIGPAIYGIKEGEISYKLEGTEGNHTLTVQFAHLGVNEPNVRGNAIYSLQIVLSEKDGQVQFNFLEEESPYSNVGLICGIYGWSNADSMLITTPSLGEPAKISTESVANMLKRGSTLGWEADDILDEDFGRAEPYCYSFTFNPTGTPDFTCEAPADLFVEQDGNTAYVTCTRPAGAPATAILFSEKPITTSPEQGVSYPVFNDAGEYVTKLGDATLIYYSNDENITATFPNLKASTTYHIKAFGVNGYPSYSFVEAADLDFISSHPAPYIMQTAPMKGGINLHTVGDYDIVIATTVDRVNTTDEGRSGIFGKPHDDCAVGDMIEGGGQVIYVGPAGDFVFEEAVANRQNYFRAWSLKEGHVSKTYINATGVTLPEMPYEPQLELYTLYEVPENWTAQSTLTDASVSGYFMPRTRGDKDEPVVAGISGNSTSTLISPTINFGRNATLKFEWAMETARDYKGHESDMVVLPEGNKPGEFGTGHQFRVFITSRGETELFVTDKYEGTMTPSATEADRFLSGTSEFLPVSVEIPEGTTSGKLNFTFSTEGFSTLYLRNISITSPSGVDSALTENGMDIICGGEGTLSILSAEGGVYDVFAVSGAKAGHVELTAGQGAIISLERGIYVVGGQKYVVK